MRIDIFPGGLGDKLCGSTDFKDIIKSEVNKRRQQDIHIIQIIKLAVQGRSRKGHRVFVLLHHIHLIIGSMLGVMGTDPDALTAVNTELVIDAGLTAPHAYGLCGAALDAVDASLAQGLIQPHRMIKFIHIKTLPCFYLCFYLSLYLHRHGDGGSLSQFGVDLHVI